MRRAIAAVIGALVLAVTAGTARAEVVDDNPAASSHGPGQVSVFIRGSDGTLQTADLSGGGFTPWRSLGGQLSSGPGAEGRAGVTDVFVRGMDNAMHQRFLATSGGWSPWYPLGGSMLSAPGVTQRNGGRYVDTYYRGPDNGIVARSWVAGAGWTGENTTALDPGLTLSAPALVSRGGDLLDVIVRGTTDFVYLNAWNGSAWSGWAEIPGGMRTQHAPAATTRRPGTLEVFARTPSGGVGWVSWDGAAWSGWKTVPGGVDSGLAAVSDHPSRIYLFARRGGEVIWNLYDDGTGPENGWSGWRPLHPPPPPPPSCDLAAGRVTGHARMVRYGGRPRLSGRARRVDGAPLVSAAVDVSPVSGGWTRTAVTGGDGHYVLRLPAGPSRRLSLRALAPGASSYACARARIKTRAGVTLKASRRVRPGGTVRFRGRLKGRPVPARGKLVELQALDGGRWRTFAQPRSRRDGRYRAAYRLRRTYGPRSFRFRARVRREAGYPYELGYSRRALVRVR